MRYRREAFAYIFGRDRDKRAGDSGLLE